MFFVWKDIHTTKDGEQHAALEAWVTNAARWNCVIPWIKARAHGERIARTIRSSPPLASAIGVAAVDLVHIIRCLQPLASAIGIAAKAVATI